MEGKVRIVFQNERTTGEIFQDAFDFLKLNFKDFINKNIKIVLPFLLLVLAVLVFSPVYTNDYLQTGKGLGGFISSVFLQLFILVLYVTILQSCTFVYIKSKINGVFGKNVYNESIYKVFYPLLILNIVICIFVFTGTLFFIVPGIYLLISLLLSPVILVFQEKKSFESIGRSFKFVNDNRWDIFYKLLLLLIISLVLNLLVSLISYLYTNFKPLIFEPGSYLSKPNILDDPVLLILYIVLQILNSLLYVYSIIVFTMTYFNIIEKRSHSRLLSDIDKIGENFEN